MAKLNKKRIILLTAIILLFVVLVTSVCLVVFLNKEDLIDPSGSGGQSNSGSLSDPSGSLTPDTGDVDDPDDDTDIVPDRVFTKPVSASSKIGVSYSVTGTVVRRQPSTGDEGLVRYPVYGRNLTQATGEEKDDFTALKQAILAENAYLNADPNGTLSGDKENFNYNVMDADGYLYLVDESTGVRTAVTDGDGRHRQLYKHTASDGMYFGNVGDDESAVIKKIKIQPRQMGNYITGLYAPAGEVVKLTISGSDLDRVGEFYVYVGATLANGQANNICIDRDFNRMPVIANRLPVNKSVCSYDEGTKTYTCYFGSYLGGPVYIGSPTVKKDFQVEISGAVEYPHLIYGLTTEEEYNRLKESSAPYFDLEVFDNTVRFSGPRLYADKYSYSELCQAALLWDKIARVSKQVPTGSNASCGIDFLFEPFVAAGAAVAFVGRNTVNCPTDWMDTCLNVDNFVLNGAWGNIHEFNHHFQNFGLPDGGEVTNNAVSLVEYSLFTKISSARSLNDSTLRDWNIYTDPSRAMRVLLENSAKGTAVGSLDAYATVLHSFGQEVFIKATKGGQGIDNWYKNLCNLTHYDFYYYFSEVLHQPLSESVAAEIAQCGYPVYVPVASIYQTGTKYVYDGEVRHITTVQPFEFTTDSYEFSVKSLVKIPAGFTITDVRVGSPEHGSIVKTGDDTYRFTPAESNLSGDIDVTLSIVKDDGAFEVEDVTLVFGFKKQQPRMADRTTYYFDGDISTMFSSVDDAVAKNYAGYTSSASFGSTFNGSECAAVWWNSEGVRINSITEYKSKIFITSTDTYRFSIRGKHANMYVSLDGENYECVSRAGAVYNNDFNVCVNNGEYKDYRLERGQVVYIKAVVVHYDVYRCAFVAGMGVVKDGSASIDDLTKRTTVYNYNYVKEAFESDYYYEREDAIDRFTHDTDYESSVVDTNFNPWDETTVLENMFDSRRDTYMHNKKGEYVNAANPFEITVDLGRVIKANTITMYGREKNTQTPKSYALYGGLSLDNMALLCEYTDEELKGYDQIGYFSLTEMRYYKLVVTKTSANYICLSGIEFGIDFKGGRLISPDDESVDYYGDWSLKYDLSAFGHSYVTESGYAEFEFVGSQMAIITSAIGETSFTVTIDGRECQCTFDGDGDVMFLSDVLDDGPHKVVIKASDKIDIEAFAVR